MDVLAAINAHSSLLHRLNDLLTGNEGESIDKTTAKQDDACELGQWLHGDGQVLLGDQPDFALLLKEHALFHRAIGRIVTLHDQGDGEKAQHLYQEVLKPHGQKIQKTLLAWNKEGRVETAKARQDAALAQQIVDAEASKPTTMQKVKEVLLTDVTEVMSSKKKVSKPD